ncbi:MAG: glucose-6-phosphate dehydrogenase [Candidatus Saccharimonadales bacterium]
MSDYRDRPLILVIFGITGDLAQRKLLPSLYYLLRRHELPEAIRIVGISRHESAVSSVYERLNEFVGDDYETSLGELLQSKTEMVQMNMEDQGAYERLYNHLNELDTAEAPAVRLYYLSVPPDATMGIIELLGKTGHNASPRCEKQNVRLLAEKPFGHDLASAEELIQAVDTSFDESQVYRIDHYLAKETAQNILTFRFENPLFEAVWDNQHIDHITVLAYEQIGIEGRVAFYERLGALRDLVQSHLLQLLALTTMARPEQLESASIHAKKLKVLEAIAPVTADEARRGQYEGYRDEVSDPESHTETYAQVRLHIDNDQWRGVPIILETGKALSFKTTEITVCFKQSLDADHEHNRLVIRIQPNEGITLFLQAKRPGMENRTETAEMDFDYHNSFSERHADAYERVIVDAIRGDQTLFASAPEVIASWRILQPVLEMWSQTTDDLLTYSQGGSAPENSLNPHLHKRL